LDRIGCGGDKRRDGTREIFDPREEGRLVKEAVIECDVETAAGLRIEKTMETGGFH
jgi:hypothetical protein